MRVDPSLKVKFPQLQPKSPKQRSPSSTPSPTRKAHPVSSSNSKDAEYFPRLQKQDAAMDPHSLSPQQVEEEPYDKTPSPPHESPGVRRPRRQTSHKQEAKIYNKYSASLIPSPSSRTKNLKMKRVDIILNQLHDSNERFAAATMLSSLSQDDKIELTKSGAAETLVEMMGGNVQEGEVACQALKSLADNQDGRKIVLQRARVIQPLLSLLNDDDVKKGWSLSIITHLSSFVDGKTLLAAAGTTKQLLFDTLIDVLTRVSTAETLSIAIAALRNLAFSEDMTESTRASVVDGLVGVLKGSHTERSKEDALRTLISIAAPQENKSLVSSKALQVLPEFLKSHHEKTRLLATDLVMNLMDSTQDNYLVNSGVVETLLTIVKSKRYADALGAIWSLSQFEKGRAILAQSGLVDDLMKLLSQNIDTHHKDKAVMILANVIDSNRAQELKVDTIIVDLLYKMLSDSLGGKLQNMADITMCICKLATSDHNKVLMGESDLAEYLLQILKIDKKECAAAKLHATRALWHLSFNDSNRAIIEREDGIKVLRQMAESTADGDLKANAKGALWVLGVRDEVVERVIAKEDPHIVISYSFFNEAVVKKISTALRGAGFQIWMDDPTVCNSIGSVAHAIDSTSVVLVCASSSYLESPRCRTETAHALLARKDVLALVVEAQPYHAANDWLATVMKPKHYDLGTPEYFQQCMKKLIADLGERVRRLVKSASSSRRKPVHKANDSASSRHVDVVAKSSSLVPFNSVEAIVAVSSHEGHFAVTSQSRPRLETSNMVASWTSKDVRGWLEQTGLSRYAKAFQEQDIDGTALEELNYLKAQSLYLFFEWLNREFGMAKGGEQLRFSSALRKLFG